MTLLNVMGLDLPILIVIGVIVLLFSGNKLAGVGKGAGRAIREFREETKSTAPISSPFAEEPDPAGPASPDAAADITATGSPAPGTPAPNAPAVGTSPGNKA